MELYFIEMENDSLPKEYDTLLDKVSPKKREQVERYRFPMDKKLSLYGELLIRCIACRRLDLHNQELEFSKTELGKPYLEGNYAFEYNLSHTKGALAAAVSKKPLGIDIEKKASVKQNIAKRFYCQEEVDYIFSEAGMENLRFFEIWTKKEAYIKWKGKGLRIPLSSFSVLEPDEGVFETMEQGEYLISLCSEGSIRIPDFVKMKELDFLKLVGECL